MQAKKNQKGDVSVVWPANSRRIAEIIRTKKCPLHGMPHKARENSNWVYLADERGNAHLMFQILRMERARVIGANRKRFENGCNLIAKPGTLKKLTASMGIRVPVLNYGPGTFTYFNRYTRKRLVYNLPVPGEARSDRSVAVVSESTPAKSHSFLANNVAKTLTQPEKQLLREYVNWIGSADIFEHHYLRKPKQYTDLFLRSKWTLLEAKAQVHSKTIRYAIGQLFDYQRHYDRRPRLAILLPKKPSASIMELLAAKKIDVVWRSDAGSFSDSVEGKYTLLLKTANFKKIYLKKRII